MLNHSTEGNCSAFTLDLYWDMDFCQQSKSGPEIPKNLSLSCCNFWGEGNYYFFVAFYEVSENSGKVNKKVK